MLCMRGQIDVQDNEATSFIFESDDARTADKLMVLIHGSGVVRAGQWARRYVTRSIHLWTGLNPIHL